MMPPCCLPLVNAIKKIKISGGGEDIPIFVCPWLTPLKNQNLRGGEDTPPLSALGLRH